MPRILEKVKKSKLMIYPSPYPTEWGWRSVWSFLLLTYSHFNSHSPGVNPSWYYYRYRQTKHCFIFILNRYIDFVRKELCYLDVYSQQTVQIHISRSYICKRFNYWGKKLHHYKVTNMVYLLIERKVIHSVNTWQGRHSSPFIGCPKQPRACFQGQHELLL